MCFDSGCSRDYVGCLVPGVFLTVHGGLDRSTMNLRDRSDRSPRSYPVVAMVFGLL